MAAFGKQRLVHFKTRLEELDCPFLDGVEDSWVEELLFNPGEARMRLLQWILGKFDSVIYQMLENQQSKVIGKNDSRLQKMLFACHLLGLCKSDDIELIQGTKSRTKQAVFMENLLDLATVIDATEQSRLSAVPLISSSAAAYAPIEEQFKHDCYFFDALCRQEDLRDIFRSKIQLFPPDLSKAVSAYEQTRLPDEKHLLSVTEKLANELEEQSKQLDDLRENVPLCVADAVTIDKVSKTLSLSLTTMSQVVSGFLHCFETEIKPWCRRPKPLLSEVGPAFSRVHSLLLKYTTLLQSFGTIQSSYNQICQESGSYLSRKHETPVAGSRNNAELHSLQGCLSVLEDSLQRLKESPVKDA